MKTILFLSALFVSLLGQAQIVKSLDTAKSCTLYRLVTQDKPMLASEQMAYDYSVYGMSIRNLEVDFNKKIVTVDAFANLVLAIDRPFIPGRIQILPSNPDFKFLINQLNRKFILFDALCISAKSELVYAVLNGYVPQALVRE